MFGPSRYLSVSLLWPLLTPDQSRWRLLAVALWPSLRSLPVRSSAAGSLPQRPDHSVEQRSPLLLRNVGNRLPIRSPQVRTRCFRAQALHLPCPPYPMGFVMGCQLARRPGLLCSFCPSPRTFALRLAAAHSARVVQAGRRVRLQTPLSPSRQVLTTLPLPSASGYHGFIMKSRRYSHRGLPPHHIAPMLGAHPALQATGRIKPRPSPVLRRWAS